MEEEIKEAEKLVKKYNNFIFLKGILEGGIILSDPMVWIIFAPTIIMLILILRIHGKLIFFTPFIFIFPYMIYLLLEFKYKAFFVKVSEQKRLKGKEKEVLTEKLLNFQLKKFIEEEELEGMELGVEEVARFAEWKEKNII